MVDSRETVSTFCPASASLSMLTTCSSVTGSPACRPPCAGEAGISSGRVLGGGRSTASTSSPALLQWSGERCVPQGDSAARSAKRPLPGVERRSARGDRPWHARARSWQRPPRRGLPCRRCWSATQVRSSGSTELLLRGRRDGKGECPSSLTSSRTAFSCTSRQRRSTSTGVRRWNATNVGGAKKQTERAARWNHPRSSSSALAAPRRPPATRRRSSARSGRELRIARRIARRHSISPSSRGCGQARPRRQGGEWQRRETHAGLRWVPYVAPRI